jgi:chemotaxis protein methyltransferase CheR
MFDEVVPADVVRHFCHIAIRRLGVGIEPKVEALVAGRVAKRLKQLQLPLDEYLNRLKEDEDCDEVVGFLDVMRPRPLRFFARWSDYTQLHAQLRVWLAAGRRRFRLWSAGCGSGEEPYGMAMTALNAFRVMRLDPETIDLKVLASDLSPRAIQRGKQGVFGEAQVRDMPAALRRRHFSDVSEGVAIDAEVKAYVIFRRLNLTRLPFPMTGPLDAIFCREGLLPLLPRARRRTMDAAKSILADDGMLCSGFDDEPVSEPEDREDSWWEEFPGIARTPGHC